MDREYRSCIFPIWVPFPVLRQLDRAKSALEDRKVIDRAKGILMKLKGLTEDEAYVLLRSTAMREKKKIGEIAQSILTASELLK